MNEWEELLRQYNSEEKKFVSGNQLIMIIDDDPGIRRALKKAFHNRGYEPVEFRTGEEAMAYLEDPEKLAKVKVVVLDVKLPKIKGNQVYRMIKGKRDVPIIIHTAYAGEDAPDCLSLNPFAYIYKGMPDSYDELCSAVEKAAR